MLIAPFNPANLYFIIAPGRSGSSLLQELFNCFYDFCNLGESRHISGNKVSCHFSIQKMRNFKPLEDYIKSKWTARYFVEKTPDSIFNIDALAERYPEANYIFLERNPYKIILSHLNKYTREALPGAIEDVRKSGLSVEQYFAKRISGMIELQVKNKPLCKHQFTIRYEELVKEHQRVLSELANYFSIVPNLVKARNVMSRPAYSSKKNTYEITELKEPEAIALVNNACKLWNYG